MNYLEESNFITFWEDFEKIHEFIHLSLESGELHPVIIEYIRRIVEKNNITCLIKLSYFNGFRNLTYYKERDDQYEIILYIADHDSSQHSIISMLYNTFYELYDENHLMRKYWSVIKFRHRIPYKYFDTYSLPIPYIDTEVEIGPDDFQYFMEIKDDLAILLIFVNDKKSDVLLKEIEEKKMRVFMPHRYIAYIIKDVIGEYIYSRYMGGIEYLPNNLYPMIPKTSLRELHKDLTDKLYLFHMHKRCEHCGIESYQHILIKKYEANEKSKKNKARYFCDDICYKHFIKYS